MKRNECFGRPGLRKRGPRPAPWPIRYPAATPDPLGEQLDRTPSRWQSRLRSLGGWLLSSRFAFLRSLGGRLLRTGSLF